MTPATAEAGGTLLHRSLGSRLAGPWQGAVVGVAAPVFTVVALRLLWGGGPLAVTAAWAVAAVASWVIAVRNWRMHAVLTPAGVVVQGWWRRHEVGWGQLESVRFGALSFSMAPGPILVRRDGTQLEVTPGSLCLHRHRLRLARQLVDAADAHGVPAWVDGAYAVWWRRSGIPVDPPGAPGAGRPA